MSLHTHPEVPDGIVPAPRPEEKPKGDLAPVPLWAPLAALIVAFFAAALSGLLDTGVLRQQEDRIWPSTAARRLDELELIGI